MNNTSAAAPALTVAEIVTLYLESLELRNRAGQYSDGQKKLTRYYLHDFCREYGHNTPDRCSQADLTRWLLAHPTWKSGSSKAAALNAVLICFRWAIREELIARNPYRWPKGLKVRAKPRQPFTPEQYRTFMDKARNRNGRYCRPGSASLRVAVYFLWHSGARTCEMRCLLRQDIDYDLGVATAFHHKTESATDLSRMIGLDDRLVRLLRWLERRRKPNDSPCRCEESKYRVHRRGDHVFRNSRGHAWTKDSFGKLFRRFARAAGIPKGLTAYCLRHGFCVAAIHKGCSDREIADQFGHSSTRMISWYGRTSKRRAEHLRKVANRVNGREGFSP